MDEPSRGTGCPHHVHVHDDSLSTAFQQVKAHTVVPVDKILDVDVTAQQMSVRSRTSQQDGMIEIRGRPPGDPLRRSETTLRGYRSDPGQDEPAAGIFSARVLGPQEERLRPPLVNRS